MMLPQRGNRNTVLTLWLSGLPAVCYILRGALSGDWSGLEWVMGSIGIVSGASAFRATGEYKHAD